MTNDDTKNSSKTVKKRQIFNPMSQGRGSNFSPPPLPLPPPAIHKNSGAADTRYDNDYDNDATHAHINARRRTEKTLVSTVQCLRNVKVSCAAPSPAAPPGVPYASPPLSAHRYLTATTRPPPALLIHPAGFSKSTAPSRPSYHISTWKNRSCNKPYPLQHHVLEPFAVSSNI